MATGFSLALKAATDYQERNVTASIFLTRVILRNYKSIAACDVRLGPLTYMVGANGSGKSNFLDALHFVRDALAGSLDNALNERGGDIRHKANNDPDEFGLRLEFKLSTGQIGHYAFSIGGMGVVRTEECVLQNQNDKHFFNLEKGILKATSEPIFPAVTPDRLALVGVSGLTAFRPVYDALSAMCFYNFNPHLIRELQRPQDGRFLKPFGENIASVWRVLRNTKPDALKTIQEYLHNVASMVDSVGSVPVGPMESMVFAQKLDGQPYPWRFSAIDMSDGTLRALGILTALFQGNQDYSPSLIGIEEPETALHPAASAALRGALQRASEQTQVIVTSHSPDLLDDPDLPAASLLAVVAEAGETKIAPVDEASRDALRDHLFSAGELLRLNQLAPDRKILDELKTRQPDLFGESVP
ncbi:AAA family ATPase [Methylomagnum sp.]